MTQTRTRASLDPDALPDPEPDFGAQPDPAPSEYTGAPPATLTRWRHRTGRRYTVIGVIEDSVAYLAEADNTVWHRPVTEFMDGRFTFCGHATLRSMGARRG